MPQLYKNNLLKLKIMDNRNGEFKEINENAFEKALTNKQPRVFKVGEIFEIRGSRLRVEKIMKNKILFKLLKS